MVKKIISNKILCILIYESQIYYYYYHYYKRNKIYIFTKKNEAKKPEAQITIK